MFDVIAFDADDTLWQNEVLYSRTQEKFKQLLLKHLPEDEINRRLYETEMRNLEHYGYGIKSFALSMIESAVELTDGRVGTGEIMQIIGFAREMMAAPTQLLEGVEQTVAEMSRSHKLMIITKGDLLDQENKLARSGLGRYFTYVEIVSEKTARTYRTILAKHNIDPRRFLMVGNSLKSDVLPILALGGQAVYIPHHFTWAHEMVPEQDRQDGYIELEHIGLLPALVERLSAEEADS